MNTASDKYGSSLDRTLGAGKPVDPATRLSELLAQSLEELTRPFDPPRGAGPVKAGDEPADAAPSDTSPVPGEQHGEPVPEPTSEHDRADADRAMAELEADLFAAAKQVERDRPVDAASEAPPDHDDKPADQSMAAHDDAQQAGEGAPNEADIVPPPPVSGEPPAPDADAARVIAKVRKLMLVSMAVTVIAVGAVFGLIGYRIFKAEGTTAKTADKLPETSAIPADMTLAIPRGARVVQSAVAGDRLVITLDVDGKLEVRTFDVKTLQPAGRLNFSGTP